MSGHNLAVPAMTSNIGSGCHLECGEDAQMWSQSRRPVLSEAISEYPSHLRVCPTTPDYAYERGGARMGVSPPTETAATPHRSPVSDIDGHVADHVRHGKQPMQSPSSPLPHPAPGRSRRRAVYVQDIVIRLLIMSQLETR